MVHNFGNKWRKSCRKFPPSEVTHGGVPASTAHPSAIMVVWGLEPTVQEPVTDQPALQEAGSDY